MQMKESFISKDGYDDIINKRDICDFHIYTEMIKDINNLSIDEEKKLFDKYRNGNADALDEIIRTYLRLVLKKAYKYLGNGLSFDDLVQEGSLGLVEAAKRFEFNHKCRFSTYAYYWIDCRMIRAIKSISRNIRLPEDIFNKVIKYKKIEKKLESKLERIPTIEEISEYMKVSVDEVKMLNNVQFDTISINDIINDSEELVNLIPSKIISLEEQVIDNSLKDDLNLLFSQAKLSEREIGILCARFGFYDDKIFSFSEIGKRYGISGERARVIYISALKKLCEIANIVNYKNYIDDNDRVLKKTL